MKNPADELDKYKLSAFDGSKSGGRIISTSLPDSGAILKDVLDQLSGSKHYVQRVFSAEEVWFNHVLDRQRFSLRFLSLVVLPSAFLVGVAVHDEKIKTSCFGMASLIVGALIQESGSQRNPVSKRESKE